MNNISTPITYHVSSYNFSKIYGDNCVVEGLNVSGNLVDNKINIHITPGILISRNAVLAIVDTVDLVFDLSDYNDQGKICVFSVDFDKCNNQHDVSFQVNYVSLDCRFFPSDLAQNLDNAQAILLGAFEFQKDEYNNVEYIDNITPDKSEIISYIDKINICEYELLPFDRLRQDIISVLGNVTGGSGGSGEIGFTGGIGGTGGTGAGGRTGGTGG